MAINKVNHKSGMKGTRGRRTHGIQVKQLKQETKQARRIADKKECNNFTANEKQ